MKIIANFICLLIPFPGIRRPMRRRLHGWINRYMKFYYLALLRHYTRNDNFVVWFDHSLGGGTETYSFRQFGELKSKKQKIIRVQYFPACSSFVISAPNKFTKSKYATTSLNDVYRFLVRLKISEIVVNNLVGYKKSLDILDLVGKIKHNSFPQPHVSFRGHDFQSICPSYNLINCDGFFCNFVHKNGCEQCWASKRFTDKEAENAIFRSGAETICDWRAAWGKFFTETLDEMIVFSEVIKKMFIKIYPQLSKKIVVIPHFVPALRKVQISKHNGINIACLGNMMPIKGRDIILEMCREIDTGHDVNIVVVGDMDVKNESLQNLTITGKYKTKNLPEIMEHYKIDLIFIPSIWPETFSYTTSEAMSMGLPVACYNMGAPAERVATYAKGLVLDEINPKHNLKELINFIKHLNKRS